MSGLLILFVTGGVLWGLYALRQAREKRLASLICASCGSKGEAKTGPKGNLGAEILLWCFFLVPGMLYSLWRYSGSVTTCKKCGSATLIPADSPVGKKLVSDFAK